MTIETKESNPLALIIDDDYDARIIFAKALEEAGYQTEIVQDGGAALSRLGDVVPTLVVLDLHLPKASGKEVLERLRSDERLLSTRVILATADALIAESLREEVDAVLLKPIDFAHLRDLSAEYRSNESYHPA